MRESAEERLIAKPESDPETAFTVTRNSTTTVSGKVGATISHTPAVNVSLGLSRSSALTVPYTHGVSMLTASLAVSNESLPYVL